LNVPEPAEIDEPPPFLGTWKRVYIAVICYLAALIFVFYLFARAYSA
jgi:hypothetical protein